MERLGQVEGAAPSAPEALAAGHFPPMTEAADTALPGHQAPGWVGLKPNDKHLLLPSHLRAQLGFHLSMLLLFETAVSAFWWLKKKSLKSSGCLNPCD